MASAFVNALADFLAENPDQRAAIANLRGQAFQRILDGGGEVSSEISGTMNGETFQYSIQKTADVLFQELGEVLDMTDNFANNRSSSFDFRFLRQT